jgi:OOP family OmpA-OmpF porin
MSNFSKAIIAIIILLLLWGGTLYFRSGPIEQDLTAHVKAALNRSEFSNVVISFEGREGTLSGSVDSQDLKKEAEQLAHEYWGVRTIDNQLEVVAASKPKVSALETAVLTGFQVGDKFVLTGTVPDDFTRSQVVEQAEAAFGNGNVADQLSVRTGLRMPAGFDKDYTQFLGAGRSKAIGFAVENDTFTLKNAVPDELAKYGQDEDASSKMVSVQEKVGVKVAAVGSPKAIGSADLQRQLDEFFKLNVVQFRTASAVLTEASKKSLDRAAEMLTRFPEKRVEVQGHTDTIGQPDANMALSDARANAVYRYLTGKGVAADRLLAKGYGDRQPIADNSTKEGRQQNRRVVFQVQ